MVTRRDRALLEAAIAPTAQIVVDSETIEKGTNDPGPQVPQRDPVRPRPPELLNAFTDIKNA
ncbi:hypothetical protein JJD41_06165 [Oxynema sp. CENA135]|uniref:hypothetical protein n=1 Tax=Oxynema sp. CENA135 TaxID=984206 RepID=UPI00190CC41F|nr:hypothetical protein [Oxynema sp. CENA135]MBK4729449.1 hypothetical protein [Oxynema sp. CENA135]